MGERDKREKIGIKSVRLEDCFQLQFDRHEWIERTQTTSNQQRTFQQHYIWCHPTYNEPAVVSKVKTAAYRKM